MATYYIDPGGDDGTGDGSIGNPWKSLAHACTTVAAGAHTIHVNAGTYTETLEATLKVGVSIEGEGSELSIINSTYTTAGRASITLSSYPTLTDGNQSISYIKLTGNSFTGRAGIYVYDRSNVSIHHCVIEDFYREGVVFKYYSNDLGDLTPIYCVGNSFHDNIVSDCAGFTAPSSAYGGLDINGQENMLIYNNTISALKAEGTNGIPLKGVNGILKNVKIYNNNLLKLPHRPPGVGGEFWTIGLELWDYRGGVEIYNNYINGSIDFGGRYNFREDGELYPYTAWIHDNVIGEDSQALSVDTYGIIVEAYYRNEDIIIERNVFQNICQGINFGSAAGAAYNTIIENIRISYNIFKSIGVDDSTGVDNYGQVLSSTSSDQITCDNLEVYNNVCVAKDGVHTTKFGLRIPSLVCTNIKFKNNIVVGFDDSPLYGTDGGDADITCDYLWIENNIFYNNGNANAPKYTVGYVPTNDTTQNNLIVDPKFVSSSDFSLQDDSPAIDAGLDVGLVSDFIGTLVPYGSAPDIGAYEWFEVEYDFSNITLVNTPACYNTVDNSIISRWVATECPINFTLLRRDWYITNAIDIGGLLAVSVYGTFTGNDGDVISVYDLTTNSMYTGTITDKSGDPVLITDIPYVSGMDIKYLNDHTLYAGYYFEGRLTINGVVESLTVIASPDSYGYADLDVSGILRIKTSIGKVTNYLSLIQKDTNKSGQFTLEYRGCWYGSNEAWISEGSQTSPASEVIWYYAECVRSEEQGCNLAEYVPTDLNDAPFLNQFDTPVYWYGLPFDLSFILPERAELSPTSDIIVTMKVYNSANVQMGADIVQTIDVDSLEGYVNSLNINSTLIDAGAAYFTVEIFSM